MAFKRRPGAPAFTIQIFSMRYLSQCRPDIDSRSVWKPLAMSSKRCAKSGEYCSAEASGCIFSSTLPKGCFSLRKYGKTIERYKDMNS